MGANVYGLRLLAQPRVRTAAVATALAVVLLFRLGQFATFATQIQWGYDFSAYWMAAAHLLHGQPIYIADQLLGPYAPQRQYLYLYPPPLAAAATPLALAFPADYRQAAWVWALLGAAIVVGVVLAVARSEGLADRFPMLAGRGRWLLVGAAFALPPVVGELVLGNVHLILLGLLTVGWLGVRRGDAGGLRWAGLAIGAATVIKLFPGLLILWFLASGRRAAALWAVAGALLIIAVSLPLTGIGPWLDYPAVLANLAAPSDTTDTLAPAVWLSPFIRLGLARLLVTAAGIGLVVWLAATAPAQAATARAAPPQAAAQPPATRAPAPQMAERAPGADATEAEPVHATQVAPQLSYAVAVLASLLIAPALYHHYLAITVLPFLLGLAAGLPIRWLALAYLLLWGGQQTRLGDLAWIVNRAMPTAGALVLLASLVARARTGPTELGAAQVIVPASPAGG